MTGGPDGTAEAEYVAGEDEATAAAEAEAAADAGEPDGS
jgi:hypothetical protein